MRGHRISRHGIRQQLRGQAVNQHRYQLCAAVAGEGTPGDVRNDRQIMDIYMGGN